MLTSNEPRWFTDTLKLIVDHGVSLPPTTWQSQSVYEQQNMSPVEIVGHTIRQPVLAGVDWAQQHYNPNLPWAEDHFQERVSGEPLNPPPSEQWWPFARKANAEHKEGEIFSHTYPERMWPRFAMGEFAPAPKQCECGRLHGPEMAWPNWGIRYEYGDLLAVVDLLTRDPLTRQAYLPIWFPEDTGAMSGQRVPCTLGYHFMFRPDDEGKMKGLITYYIRSCDALRHLKDDAYMAARLLQWVVGKLRENEIDAVPSALIMHISSLHIFAGDILYANRWLTNQEDEYYGYGV